METLVNVIGQKIQRTTSMEDTLQTAIRELGMAVGATRVRASLKPASNVLQTVPIALAEPLLVNAEGDGSSLDHEGLLAD
jgi:hypothetical protein